jgi:LCP family protein required for cell wall assembly
MTGSMTRSFPRVLLGRFAVALAVSVPLVLGGVVGVNAFIDKKIDEIPRVKVKTAENTDPGQPANFLLIGSDTRADVQTPEEKAAFGDASSEGGQRSDTLMVIHVDPEQKTGFLVSFPRDLAVNVPGLGQQKINAAFNSASGGGPQRVVDTLQQDFNVPIQHYIEVDFQSFKGIVDAMGGVPVYIDAPSRDAHSGFEFIPFNLHCAQLRAVAGPRAVHRRPVADGSAWRPRAHRPSAAVHEAARDRGVPEVGEQPHDRARHRRPDDSETQGRPSPQ